MRTPLLCMCSALFLFAGPQLAASNCADVALILAVDGSDSVDDEEYAFQKSSIAAAFRDETVLFAMKEAGAVAVSAVFWADGEYPPQKLAWFVIDHGEGAERFAREIENNHRVVFGDTDIGNGIWSALSQLSEPGFCADRLIVDISGDGMETLGSKRQNVIPLHQARLRARQMGVTINALAISDDEGALADYYARKVILGTDAFVMPIKRYADYSQAVRKKLVRELSFRADNRRSLINDD